MNASRPSPSELDPRVIEQAIVDGSRSAFIRLYHHYEGKVRYGVARAALKAGRSMDVEELIQEVWCRFMSNDRRLLSYYDAERGHFGPYIGWIAYQQAIYVMNRQRRRALGDDLTQDADSVEDDRSTRFEAEVIQSDLFGKLLDQVDSELTESDRVLLREHYLAERSLGEIAKELGIREDAIYQRNHRLKKKLLRVGAQLKLSPSSRESPSAPSTVTSLLLVALLVQLHGQRQDVAWTWSCTDLRAVSLVA